MEGVGRTAVRSSVAELSTNILLVGMEWEPLSRALGSLKVMPTVRLLGPVAESAAASFQPRPSLLLIAPDVSRDRLAVGLRERSGGPPTPLTLRCITSEDLEDSGLYEDADDFVITPCSAPELEMRVRRLMVRLRSAEGAPVLRVGNVALDTVKYQVTVGAVTIGLAWMEFKLLRLLMERPGTVFTRELLLAQVWGTEHFGGTRTVDVHVRRLRAKLGEQSENILRTVRNVGYGVVAPTA
ncbi:MAG: response regulator transcription factor [SAR202 cluster bacterium]|nr:response regulator transcription factor [SAR202 cluster bacterium]